jgi:DNA (cytosine-5)-methyltransferase 1
MEQMIGNAVPIKLAEFVAHALVHHIGECERQIDYAAFADWLTQAQPLCERTRHDTISRLKRADAICALPPAPDAYYLFTLEQSENYQSLTPTARSQLKQAVTLYAGYRQI